MELDAKKRFLIEVAFFTVWAVGIFLLLRFAWAYLAPFVIGGVLAYAVQKPAGWIAQKTIFSKSVWAVCLTILVYLILLGAVIFLFWQLTLGGQSLFGKLSRFLELLNKAFSGLLRRMGSGFDHFSKDAAESARAISDGMRKDFISRVGGFFSKWVTGVATRVPAFLLSALVSLVAGCFFAKDYDRLSRFVKGLLSNRQTETARRIHLILKDSVWKLSGGYAAIAGLTFLELLIGLTVLRVGHVVGMALFITVVDIFPVLGTGTVLLPWSVYCFLNHQAGQGTGILILYILMTVVRNFAEPHFIGNRTGMNPVFSLIAVFLGLRIGGFFGMIFLPLGLVTVVSYYRNQLQEEKQNDKSSAPA
ncbi:MAG: AI-2E family transporter [Clostridia bacterium]|nr:AI-2E family transporter [Clostridia bacterium]